MTEHMHAPWHTDEDRIKSAATGIYDANGDMLALVYKEHAAAKPWLMPLLLAAPELLEAVRAWLSERDNPSPCWVMKKQAEAKMRAAIAKAEGRASDD